MATIKKKAYAKKGYAAKKKPDQELLALAQNMSGFMTANRKTITIAASVLAALLVLFAAFSFKKSLDEQNAGPLLAAAYEQYTRNTGPSADYAKALDLFRAVHKKYPSTTSGTIAAYYYANCLMNLGKNEEALKEYQSFISDHNSDKFMLGLVYTRMGYLYNALGKQTDAVKAFEQADSLTGPGIATFELARLYEAAGNSAASQKKYKLIADKLAGTAWAVEAVGKVRKTESAPGAAPLKENKEKANK